jgi:hypothetical protein
MKLGRSCSKPVTLFMEMPQVAVSQALCRPGQKMTDSTGVAA